MRAPPYRSLLSSFLVLLIVVLVACVATVPNGGAAPRDAFAGVLSVDNAQFPDVDVYVLRDGTTVRRVGEVTGFNIKHFPLRSGDVIEGSTIQFAAHAVGSRQRFDYVSVTETAHVGAKYEWRLGIVGPGTDALSWRRSAASLRSRRDSEPPNRSALRVGFGVTNVTRADSHATFVIARR